MSKNSDALETIYELMAVAARPLVASSQNAISSSAGPSFSDLIYVKLLACFVQDLPDAWESRRQAGAIKAFIEANPYIAKWLAQFVTRPDGRRNLEALWHAESGLRRRRRSRDT